MARTFETDTPPPEDAAPSPDISAPPTPSDQRSHEQWAEAKGFLPMWAPGSGAFGQRPNPEYWRYDTARALCRWMDGQLLTEQDFDVAVQRVQTLTCR